MNLWALRHGQSEYNLLGLCNDVPARNVSLTAEGRRQAARAAKRLQTVAFDAAFSSPLPRAVETAGILVRGRDCRPQVDARLADIRSGFDGRPVAEYFSAIAHDPLNARANDGESLRQHAERVTGFLEWLRTQPCDDCLVVAHEETLRVIKAFAEGLAIEAVVGLPFANCEPCRFRISPPN